MDRKVSCPYSVHRHIAGGEMNNNRNIFVQVKSAIKTPASINKIIATAALKYFDRVSRIVTSQERIREISRESCLRR